MTFSEIEERARAAGLPPPTIVGDRAVILVPLRLASAESEQTNPAQEQAAVTPEEFAAWAKSIGGWQAAADYLNRMLGRSYTRQNVRRWGSPDEKSWRPVPNHVSAIVAPMIPAMREAQPQ